MCEVAEKARRWCTMNAEKMLKRGCGDELVEMMDILDMDPSQLYYTEICGMCGSLFWLIVGHCERCEE